MKNRTSAGLFALLLGGFGAHKFYLGRTVQGILYFLFCWTFIPGILALIEGIRYLTMSDEEFNKKYNNSATSSYGANIVNVSVNSIAEELEKAKRMKDEGIITEEEFEKIKVKFLKLGKVHVYL